MAFVAATFVGILVYFAVRLMELALIWAGVTFIVAIVGMATLALLVPEQDQDPNKPMLR